MASNAAVQLDILAEHPMIRDLRYPTIPRIRNMSLPAARWRMVARSSHLRLPAKSGVLLSEQFG